MLQSEKMDNESLLSVINKRDIFTDLFKRKQHSRISFFIDPEEI